MKTETINRFITLMAVVGVFIFVGAVGAVDYHSEVGVYYPLVYTIRAFVIAFLFCLPAIIREVRS